MNKDSVYARIYRCVAKIPRGKVATYGQLAKLINASGARQIGYALASTPPDIDIPWHRVINARGEISQRSNGIKMERKAQQNNPIGDSGQYQRLVAEGVLANKNGRIDLSVYQWVPGVEQLLDDEEAGDEQAWLDQAGIG